jgi:ubiquinone/menaquinone biosynthesis C-methylase UbiE
MIESEAWPSLWRRHLDTYLAKPPRTGYWADAWFGRRADSFLELGCGSGRDALYLAKRGHRVVGTDLDAETLDELNRRFQKETISFRTADAAALDFPDDGFDVVYHNGLWVLFEDDDLLITMLKEQVRVAKKFAVILVHNAANQTLVDQFKKRSEADELYDIRFFIQSELEALIQRSGIAYKSLKMLKFGGRMDLLYQAKRVKKVIPNVVWPIREKAVPKLYQLEDWTRIERIACVIEL